MYLRLRHVQSNLVAMPFTLLYFTAILVLVVLALYIVASLFTIFEIAIRLLVNYRPDQTALIGLKFLTALIGRAIIKKP